MPNSNRRRLHTVAGLKLIIALADEIENQGMFMNTNESHVNEEERLQELNRKQTAFKKMEAMRKESPFPKDFDYEKAREEAVSEKYGRWIDRHDTI